MKQSLSPKQLGKALGVSEASVKRWCDQGLVPADKTAGGHRRIAMADALAFIRARARHPTALDTAPEVLKDAGHALGEALLAGFGEKAKHLIADLMLQGYSAVEICDRVITQAFRLIGERWSHGAAEIFEERRACEICLEILRDIKTTLLDPADEAPLAIGATLPGDFYQLPVHMAEIALREAAWRTQILGTSLPLHTVLAAIQKIRPRLLWLSVSHITDEHAFLADFSTLTDAANAHGAAVVIGGSALHTSLRQRMRYAGFCDTFDQLSRFARNINSAKS